MFSIQKSVTAFALGAILFGPAAFAAPNLQKRQTWTNGICTGHITHWQKDLGDDVESPAYEIDLQLFDGNGQFLTGFSRGRVDDEGRLKVTNMPTDFVIETGDVDKDPIDFEYDGYTWSCPGDRCSIGGYEDMNREADFNFPCDNLPTED